MTNHFPFFLQLKVVTGQLFLPELVAFKTTLWLKGFTLGFPGSNIQSFTISVQDLEKFLPLPDQKICKWLILVWEYCPDQMLAWFPKSTKVKLITCFHDFWIYDFFSRFFLQGRSFLLRSKMQSKRFIIIIGPSSSVSWNHFAIQF